MKSAPAFLKQAGRVLNSGQARTLLLTGNIYDLFGPAEPDQNYVPLLSLLTTQWDLSNYLLIVYELNGPIRFVREADAEKVRNAWLKWRSGYDANELAIKRMLASSKTAADLEAQALQHSTRETLNKIIKIKKEVVHLRQIIGPQREVLARFARGEFKLIRPHLVPYYRNVYDGLYHISELAQNYMDALTGILQVYLNMSSNQTGEVVKLLTLITVITTPLMMIGTWYGMNFEGMPELHWKHGYYFFAALTVLLTAVVSWYFKRRGWF
jgi:Mg2+ and Co2+ transporter CorA